MTTQLAVPDELSVAPTVEPVTVKQIEQRLKPMFPRSATPDERAQLNILIKSARQLVEERQGSALITQTRITYRDTFPGDDGIILPRNPVSSISSVTYVDGNGATQTVATSVYELDAKRWGGGRVILKYDQDWPAGARGHTNDIAVTYVCGYGAAGSTVPQYTVMAIIHMVVQAWVEELPCCSCDGLEALIDAGSFSVGCV